MKEANPIIAAIDFSQSSPSVLHHSLYVSASNSAPVIALHILDENRLPGVKAKDSEDPEIKTLVLNAKSRLESWLKKHTSVEPPENMIRVGHPGKQIQKCVEETHASLLVIAANDTTKSRMGAIASRCVRTVQCDVMVLRRKQRGNFKRVMICTDFSATSALALERAIATALKEGAELHIVHTMYPPAQDVWGEVLEHKMAASETYQEECRSRVDSLMKTFIAPHLEALSQFEYSITILESVCPSIAITAQIKKVEADLIVLGTRGHSPMMSHFLGTNAERLMHDSPVSVLAVRSLSPTS
ncbi:MAG: universal stress protein [Roseibacillus sp.]